MECLSSQIKENCSNVFFYPDNEIIYQPLTDHLRRHSTNDLHSTDTLPIILTDHILTAPHTDTFLTDHYRLSLLTPYQLHLLTDHLLIMYWHFTHYLKVSLQTLGKHLQLFNFSHNLAPNPDHLPVPTMYKPLILGCRLFKSQIIFFIFRYSSVHDWKPNFLSSLWSSSRSVEKQR